MKPELGKKRTCSSCNTRYYDMGREVPQCPNCGLELGMVSDAVLAAQNGEDKDDLKKSTAFAALGTMHHFSNEEVAELEAMDDGDEMMGLDDVGEEFDTKETDEDGNSYLEDFSELDDFDPSDEVELDRM